MERSHASVSASDFPTPRQMKEFWLQATSGRITRKNFQAFLPDEIAEARGLSYSEAQLKRLAGMLPSEDVLRWCKANNYAVMACPPKPMSFLEVRVLNPEIFYSKSGGWYVDQAFAEGDKTGFGWLAIRKDVVPKSLNKNLDEQLSLLAREEFVPNAGEFSWFITTYYEVHGVRLFGRTYARTSSVASGGIRVHVGYLDSGGLDAYYYRGGGRGVRLGVSSARKF